jgi:hypothetical protein
MPSIGDLADAIKAIVSRMPAAKNQSAAPRPQAAAGVGGVTPVVSAVGGAFSYPAGGTWDGRYVWYVAASGFFFSFSGGVASGGANINGGTPNITWAGVFWEIMGPGSFDSSKDIIQRKDGSFEVTKGKHRFHVLSIELADKYGLNPKDVMAAHPDYDEGPVIQFYREVTELWDEVSAFAAEHPERVLPEPEPPAVPMDPEMQLNAEIMASLVEGEKKKPEWMARAKALKESK